MTTGSENAGSIEGKPFPFPPRRVTNCSDGRKSSSPCGQKASWRETTAKYYRECVTYIAALGEAKEAAGQRDAKQTTMAKYMEAYSRRSSFRGEMEAFGMRDPRKK